MAKLTYTINSEKIDGESATVNLKVNGPDMSKVLAEFMQKALTTNSSNLNVTFVRGSEKVAKIKVSIK